MSTNDKNIPVHLVLQNIRGAYNRFSDEYDTYKKGPEGVFDRCECLGKLECLRYLYNYFEEHYGNK